MTEPAWRFDATVEGVEISEEQISALVTNFGGVTTHDDRRDQFEMSDSIVGVENAAEATAALFSRMYLALIVAKVRDYKIVKVVVTDASADYAQAKQQWWEANAA